MIDVDKLEAGPELDALVAERVMGCKPTWEFPESVHREPHCGCPMLAGGRWPHGRRFEGCDHDGLSHYSVDIAAAWEVIDALRSHSDEVKRRFEDALTEATGGCPAAYEGPAIFDITPLLICRAALKAVGA